ncbi:MAG: acyl-CoA dehydrogenase family protein [Candidatus Hadarchaeales archaeon]
MDFELREEESIFRNTLREFLDKEIAPIADKRDKKGPLTKEEVIGFYKKFKKIGLGFDPETAKGWLKNPMFFGIAAEEISRVWASLFAVWGYQVFASLAPLASEESAERLLPKLEKAELIGCLAVTEPGAGSDTSKLQTTATPDGDHYIIQGRKCWITNAPIADVALVAATEKDTGIQNFFFIDREISPFETTELHKIGWRAAPTGEMIFDNCRVPKENALTEMLMKAFTEKEEMRPPLFDPEFGVMKLATKMRPLSAIFCLMRTSMALQATGISQAALDASLKYAKERVQFGKPIGRFQLIQEMLYEMTAIVESSRLLAYRALDAVWKGNPEARKWSSLAKCYACEGCIKVTYDAIQIHGGIGLSDEYPLERYFRDARIMTIGDGTTEIQKMIVGRELLGKGFSAYT